MAQMRTILVKGEDEPIKPEPNIKRIPVRLDDKTIIMVREGANIQEHIEKYKNRPISAGYID